MSAEQRARRVLVIDDAATVRLYHRKLLAEAGWHVEEAANGLEGLERLHGAREPFDLFVVDVNMPKLDGYSFVRELRRVPGLAQAPVLMVSTEAQAGDSAAAQAAGANAYIVKPAKPHLLVLDAALLMGDRDAALAAAARAPKESA